MHVPAGVPQCVRIGPSLIVVTINDPQLLSDEAFYIFGSSPMIQLSRISYRHHIQAHSSKISTSLHGQLQSIRFILPAFGLAPVAGMDTLNKLIPDNL